MKILQIEDRVEFIDKVKKICNENNIKLDCFKTFFDATEALEENNYDFYILDGAFPLKKEMKADAHFPLIIEYLKILKKFDKKKVIAWSNGSRTQKYCMENNIRVFRKEEPEKECIDKLKKLGLEKPVEVADETKIFEDILG